MVKAKKALDSLALLKEAGYRVPDKLVEIVEDKVYNEGGLKQVWKCAKCRYELKQYVRIGSASHRCASAKSQPEILLTKVWEAPLETQ